ncbi:MAG: hypothetical protein Q8N81_05845 [bacterium]|nr:hypothetical protein [bacterium]
MGNLIFWIVLIAIVGYIYLRRKNKIPPITSFKAGPPGSRQKDLVIKEDAIVEQWSQLLLGMGGKGEELLKSISGKLQELKMPDVVIARKEATLGRAEVLSEAKAHEFVTMKHPRYSAYEMWIGAIDRAGQLKVSWYLTVALPGGITGRLRASNKADRDAMPRPMRAFSLLPKKLGKMMAQKINAKISGHPAYIRVRPEDMTMDDKEELGAYITTAHNVVLTALEELMNNLNLDFSKVDKHTEGFLNLS